MTPPRYIPHYKLEDYRQWEGDWELWSGVAVSMIPAAKRPHQEVCGELYLRLRRALEESGCEHCSALFELDWVVNEDTVLRPDLMIACGQERSDYLTQAPDLVIEVLSESTRKRDLVYKRELYEQLGVAHYLTVEPSDGTWQALQNSGAGFEPVDEPEFTVGESCRLKLDLSDLPCG